MSSTPKDERKEQFLKEFERRTGNAWADTGFGEELLGMLVAGDEPIGRVVYRTIEKYGFIDHDAGKATDQGAGMKYAGIPKPKIGFD